MRVLIIEDEKKVADGLMRALESEGYRVEHADDGEAGLSLLLGERFDAAILDIMLPGCDGLEVLRELREKRIPTPVLLLSARSAVNDRVLGLDAGADDYLPKPFAVEELTARLRVMLRRTTEQAPNRLQVGDLILDTMERRAVRQGKEISLSNREFRLLELLMRNAGQICGRMTILKEVWDYDFDPGSNIIEVYILRLRRLIDRDSSVRLLHTIRGIGYMLKEGV